MTESFIVELLILAALLAFIVFKLRAALGRKTGHERPRPAPYSARQSSSSSDNVVTLPNRQGGDTAPAPEPAANYAPEGSALAQGLTDIQLADRSFDPSAFLEGAKGAYEMIVTAFAQGDARTLKQLSDSDTFEAFREAIDARKEAGETQETTFIGFRDAKITEARMTDRNAEVTVTFEAELISVTKNADGAVIDGDPNFVHTVTDIWTFARDTRSADPNWILIETAEGEEA